MKDALELRITRVRNDETIEMPQHMSDGASGIDICVNIENDIELMPLKRVLVPTGIAVSIPQGYEGQIRPRSGLAIKHGITLLNTPGTIDSDYRGEINLIVINLGSEPFIITNGMRLAQMVIAPYMKIVPTVVDKLDETFRGASGFGHTGV